MAYGDFKDLNRRAFADKVLRDKAFNITKNPKYDGYQCGLSSMVYNFWIKKFLAVVLKVKIFLLIKISRRISNQPLIRTLLKEKYIHLLLAIFRMQI